MHRWIRLILLSFLAACGAERAVAAESPTLLVIFDGSGSMWGKPDGWTQTKLAVAREGLNAALSGLPKDAHLGLVSFGHRRGGDCSDVETILKPVPDAAGQMLDLLEKLNPRGRGPITAALREAARQLEGMAGPAAVLLIHDDADNCQLDPCSTLALLQKAKPDVRVHVVSMTSRPADARHMTCLTEPTKGLNAHVTRASEVVALLQEIVGTLPRGPVPPVNISPPPALPAPAPLTGAGLHVTARLGESGPVVAEPVRWRILRDDTTTTPVATATGPGPTFHLASGNYRVEARLGLAQAETRVTVQEGKPQTLAVAITAGYVRFAQDPAPSRPWRDAVIAIERLAPPPEAAAPVIVRGLGPQLAVAPGDYRLTVTTGALRLERLARISVGQVTPLTPPLDLGEVVLNATAAKAALPLVDASFAVYEDDPDAAGGRREVAHAAGPDATVSLPAGNFAVVARANGIEARERIQVRPGARQRVTIVLESGFLTVTIRLAKNLAAGAPTILHLRREGQSGIGHALYRSPASATLPAGNYAVEARIGLHNATLLQNVQVKAGERTGVTLTIPAGQLTLRARSESTGAPLPGVTWEFAETSGTGRFEALEAQPQLLLKPGKYAVTLHQKGRAWARDVDVKAGEATAIDLVVP